MSYHAQRSDSEPRLCASVLAFRGLRLRREPRLALGREPAPGDLVAAAGLGQEVAREEGDVLAALVERGQVDLDDVQKILDRGVRFIYTSPYGRPEKLRDHENLIWLDLPWRPGDATVDVPGYSVRILPMSSSAHTIVYFQLMCELARRMGWT